MHFLSENVHAIKNVSTPLALVPNTEDAPLSAYVDCPCSSKWQQFDFMQEQQFVCFMLLTAK